jgi:hypothetical protein
MNTPIFPMALGLNGHALASLIGIFFIQQLAKESAGTIWRSILTAVSMFIEVGGGYVLSFVRAMYLDIGAGLTTLQLRPLFLKDSLCLPVLRLYLFGNVSTLLFLASREFSFACSAIVKAITVRTCIYLHGLSRLFCFHERSKNNPPCY